MLVKPEYTHNYHPQPRLSANQVADYVDANATNRNRILKEAKFPSTAVLIRYEDAKNALISHLAGSSTRSDGLARKLQVLQHKIELPETTKFARDSAELCIDAIEAFQSHEASLGIGRAIFLKPTWTSTRRKISGVSISTSIDLRVERIGTGGQVSVGAAILMFSKTGKDIEKRCKTVTLLVYELLKALNKDEEVLDPKLCLAIDVFRGKVYPAKGEQRLLLKTVENSCGEVAGRWPTVEPPKNYYGPPVI